MKDNLNLIEIFAEINKMLSGPSFLTYTGRIGQSRASGATYFCRSVFRQWARSFDQRSSWNFTGNIRSTSGIRSRRGQKNDQTNQSSFGLYRIGRSSKQDGGCRHFCQGLAEILIKLIPEVRDPNIC